MLNNYFLIHQLLFQCQVPPNIDDFFEAAIEVNLQMSVQEVVRGEITVLESMFLRKDITAFWETNPQIKIAYDLLKCNTPTSVKAERSFSDASHLVTKFRSALSDNRINSLTFLKNFPPNLEGIWNDTVKSY